MTTKLGAPNILILGVQVPFTRGGAEILNERLKEELLKRDYCADIVQIPFSATPKTNILHHMSEWRSLDLRSFAGRKVDLVIATKFPSYLVRHPNKVVWLVHQHRQVYDLYDSRFGDFHVNETDEALRRMTMRADARGLGECKRRFGISENVCKRLERYLGMSGETLFPPLPYGNRYHSNPSEDFILSVGRICSIKRVDLIVRALPMIDDRFKLKIVGEADEPSIDTYLKSEIDKHHLWGRVEFLGRVDDEMLLSLYSRCAAVYYAPFDEDYGFVTLEALSSGKPVVTCTDSGTVLEFVSDEENGLIVEPAPEAIANAFNRLAQDAVFLEKLSLSAQETCVSTSWDQVVEQLTLPLREEVTSPMPIAP